MAKREDTQWGDDDETSLRGAELTFFFTNAIPQHGHLNVVAWKGLEDYILEVATNHKKATEEDGYKISIFTGPVFQEDDPKLPISEKEDVQIPVLFWKVVYFKNKSEDKLYRIGFMMGQEKLLKEAFGTHSITSKGVDNPKKEAAPFFGYKDKEVFQVNVALIEEKTKMKFHPAEDPMEDFEVRQITEVVRNPKKKGIYGEQQGSSKYRLEGLKL